jgi:hypothetical protein
MKRRRTLAAWLRLLARDTGPIWLGAIMLSLDTSRDEMQAARKRAGS